MRNATTCVLVSATVLLTGGSAATGQSHLMRFADIHEDQIVFTYEGDLWLVPADGGLARRITNDPGVETRGKFSPDGSKIAFTGEYDGGVDVYVMDARGGVPKRLTYHPHPDEVLGWFPDGKHVLFRSPREYSFRAEQVYKVSIEGGMPVKLPVDRAGLTTVSPDGKSIAYNRITRESNTWKRHQGGTAQDIWMGSLEDRDYRKITQWPGTDNYPMWNGNAIYFTSDREYGTLNIYKYDVDAERITPLTDYRDYDVKYPSIGPKNIVYQHEETLHLLNIKTGKTKTVPVEMASDRVRTRPEFVPVEPTTGSFGLSPSGKRVLLEARGEIINFPAEDGEPVNLTKATASREKNAAWSPDGRWIVFLSDLTGEEELYLVDQKAEEPWKQLTTGGLGFRMQPVWSPDSKWLIFSDKFMRLNLVDADSGEMSVIDQGEYDDAWERWGIQEYVWSPDSKWVAYTKMEQSINESIFLYSIKDKGVYRVTSEMTEDFSPSFDPEGRYLYFFSHRSFKPIMGFVDQNHVFLDMCRPYIVLLAGDAASPFAPKDSVEEVKEDKAEEEDVKKDEGGKAEKEESEAEESGEKEGKQEDKEDEDIRIDLEGIRDRIILAEGVPAGNYFRLEATDNGFLYLAKTEHEFEKYQTVTDHTKGSLELHSYDLKEDKDSTVLSGIANYHLSADRKKLVYRAGSTYGVVDAGAKSSVGDGKVDLGSIKIKVERLKEYMQIFNEAWRIERDWFYDPNMHGVDWEAIGEKYRKFVPYCGNRVDLTYLIGEMIAELNIGHTYVWGGDVKDDAKFVPTGFLGADLVAEAGSDYYRIAHIFPGTPWEESERSPLAEPGCPIKEGDYLIAIDGEEVSREDNVFRLLQNKREAVVTLTYNEKPSAEDAKAHRVKTAKTEVWIRYREWVEKNRAFVERASNGRLGYVHIPDMGKRGVVEFARAFFPQHYKNGMIIDERYNGGGFTSHMIIDRLDREVWAMTQPREGKPLREPERGFYGHWVVLVNEDTGSAGEWFAQEIKSRGLAPIIGMRTWGGAVGIEPHQSLIDGGMTTPPQFGPYDLDREWIIEGHGVIPDVEVQNMPGDVVRGKDAQLEAGIDYIMNRLKEDPKELPPPPPYPDKSKKE